MQNFDTNDIDTYIWVYGRALCHASARGHLKLAKVILQKIETLLEDKWHPYDCDDWIDAALEEAASHGHRSVVQLLHEKGANINVYSKDGTPLVMAAAAGRGDVGEYLLENGADVHTNDKYGYTALHKAARVGDVKAVKALLEYEANVDYVGDENEDRNTALLLAVQEGHEDVVTLLLEKGANARHVNACDETALQLAESSGREEVARLLRE
ncbi:hypothetical protein IFM61392_10218 [Aspergillus lentulus]|nr:hypothetical protein IFM61392_10218 [Aspergillus lentulus]